MIRQCSLRGRNILYGRNPNVWGPRQRGIHFHKRRKRQPYWDIFENLIICLFRLFAVSGYSPDLQCCLARGIPIQDFPSFLRGLLKDLSSFSPHIGSRPKPLLHSLRYFCCSITQCCWALQWRGSTTPFLVSSFRGGSLYSYERLVRKVSELIFIYWHQGQASPIIDNAVHSPYCIIPVHMCSEGLHHHLGGRDIQ